MASGNCALILFDCEVVCINNGVLKTVIPPDILYDLNSCDFYQGFTVWENEGILQLISGKARSRYLVAWAVLIFACAYFKHILGGWLLYFRSCYKPHSLGLFSANELYFHIVCFGLIACSEQYVGISLWVCKTHHWWAGFCSTLVAQELGLQRGQWALVENGAAGKGA